MHQMNVIFGITGILRILILNMSHIIAMNGHDLMQKAMNFNDVAFASGKGSDYRIHFWYMNKHDAINIINNFNLNEKRGRLCFFYYI